MWSNVSNRKFWLFDGETHGVLYLPWQVFSRQSMEMFLVRTILPKLAYCLQMELHVNPQRQEIG